VSDVVSDVGRHAVLVDAGYLYASVGQLVLGRTSRREFRVATEPLIGALLARADRTTPGELLRMYWYDAARDRVPTVEQRQIAALPHVKVRLGNLNSAGQQKGVDAQLRQDLEELARHRAVTDVVLIAGDEDMVPAVEAAQAYGVRVHVWGVEPPYGVNQAERLVWEADTVDQLDAEFCRPYVEAEPEAAPVEPAAVEAEPEPREDKPAVPTPADVFAARKGAAAGPPPRPVGLPPPGAPSAPDRAGPERPEMEQIGARIAARWLLTRGRENVADLLPGPVLPTVIDKELLVEAEEEISRSLRPYEEARRALRDGFWARLHQEFGIQPAMVPPYPTPTHDTPAVSHPGPAHPAPSTPPASHPAPIPDPAGAAASSSAPHPGPASAAAAPPPHSGPANAAASHGYSGQAGAASHPASASAPDPGPATVSHAAASDSASAPHPGPADAPASYPAPHPGPAGPGSNSAPTHAAPAPHPGPASAAPPQPVPAQATSMPHPGPGPTYAPDGDEAPSPAHPINSGAPRSDHAAASSPGASTPTPAEQNHPSTSPA
jgi:uncharacterized LabA/DUF88 family protein